MSDSQERPWSDNPNAPKIPYNLYFDEKAYFAGTFVGSILYGTREASLHKRLSIRAHFVRSVYSRDRRSPVLQMHRRAI